ncbi:MAG: SDR family oxidoreductase [Thermoguttaceae bacterium]
MNVLVTGGAGYIGTTLIPLLLSQGHRVSVFDSLCYGIEPILPFFRNSGFSFTKGDIRDRQSLAVFARTAEAVIHLAAIVGYPACLRAPEEAKSVNLDGARNVAAVAGRRRPVIFASTSSCYGSVQEAICTEDTPLRPLSLYGESKVQGENIIRDMCDAVVYRIATAYGLSPRMRLDLLINDFVYRALHERRLRVYEGSARRSFIHVSDIARGINLALDKFPSMTGQVYNLGHESQNHSKLDICRLISQIIPGVTIEECADAKDLDRRDYTVSYARIKALGFQTAVSVEDGIRELCGPLQWIDNRDSFSNRFSD